MSNHRAVLKYVEGYLIDTLAPCAPDCECVLHAVQAALTASEQSPDVIAAYGDAVEELTTDVSELEGDDAGYVAISKRLYDALLAVHAKAQRR